MSIHCAECGTFLYSQMDGGYATWRVSIVRRSYVSNMEKTICRQCFGKIKGNELKDPIKRCFMIDTKDAFDGATATNHHRELLFYEDKYVSLMFPKSYSELLLVPYKKYMSHILKNWVKLDYYRSQL